MPSRDSDKMAIEDPMDGTASALARLTTAERKAMIVCRAQALRVRQR